MKHNTRVIFLTILALLAFSIASVSAQDSLECGDAFDDELEGETLSFMLELEEGSGIAISLESDDFDALLELYDEDGELVASDDDGGDGLNSLLTFSGDGEYELVVTSFGDAPEGDFELSLECTGDCEVFEDELTEDDTSLEFELGVEAETSFVISAESDDFDTLINVLDEDGELVASDDDGGDGFNSRLGYTFEDDGEFTVEVTSFLGDGEGDFMLTICSGIEADIESDGGGFDFDFEEISCDTTIEGTMDDDSPFFIYTFEGEEGDEVTITLTATDGDLDPLLGLFSDIGSDEPLVENDDADGVNSEIEYELEDDGMYIIVATRFGFEEGSTSGEFEFELSCD